MCKYVTKMQKTWSLAFYYNALAECPLSSVCGQGLQNAVATSGPFSKPSHRLVGRSTMPFHTQTSVSRKQEENYLKLHIHCDYKAL